MIDIKSISSGLTLRNDGIWCCADKYGISYPSEGNEVCFAVEDLSFWFKHRNNCITCIVKAYPPKRDGSIFDIGGGNGFVSLGLAKEGFDVVLVEPGATGALNAKFRGLKKVIWATMDSARFKPQSLPAVGLFDVLEHIEDDIFFLKTIKRLLIKGGYLYLTVPSFGFLWSEEDDLAGHFRRYSLKNISGIIESVGFNIDFSSYIFCLLPVPVFILRTIPYRMGITKNKNKITHVSRDHAINKGILTKLLSIIFKKEIENLKNKRVMKFGGSCLVVARRP